MAGFDFTLYKYCIMWLCLCLHFRMVVRTSCLPISSLKSVCANSPKKTISHLSTYWFPANKCYRVLAEMLHSLFVMVPCSLWRVIFPLSLACTSVSQEPVSPLNNRQVTFWNVFCNFFPPLTFYFSFLFFFSKSLSLFEGVSAKVSLLSK